MGVGTRLTAVTHTMEAQLRFHGTNTAQTPTSSHNQTLTATAVTLLLARALASHLPSWATSC